MSQPPENCPGVGTESSGKASACEGCPNQKVCASGEVPKVDPDIAAIANRLSNVKHKILILSGKGGVGKSTVSAQFAYALAASGKQVGLLDIDICGPSMPKMFGLEGEEVHMSNAGWSPVYVEDNLGVMSIGFMLPNTNDAVIWRGARKNTLIKQFLRDVYWGDEGLDYLIIDAPPGTSDEHISLAQLLKLNDRADGAVIVTTPQEVSLIDVRKELSFCKKTKIPVVGVIENMSGFHCPCCSTVTQIFPSSSGGGRALAQEYGVSFLGAIPLDPQLTQACEEGRSFFEKDSATSKAFKEVVAAVEKATA